MREKKKAYSIKNVISKKFKVLEFDGGWKESIGCPELSGSWMIYGDVKNGKTTLGMQMGKYLTKFGRVAYNSVEEGLSLSIQKAMERTGMIEASRRMILLDKEEIKDLKERLKKHRSPEFVIIDSIQFSELLFSEYKELKSMFPNKLFIYISHVERNIPSGGVARRIWRDANVTIRVEGFKGFPKSRYGGGKEIVIDEEKANEYWGIKLIGN
jgi:hypothetical protein